MFRSLVEAKKANSAAFLVNLRRAARHDPTRDLDGAALRRLTRKAVLFAFFASTRYGLDVIESMESLLDS